MDSSVSSIPPHVRDHVLEFLIFSSMQLRLAPIVKYTALSLFSDRFFPSLQRKTRFLQDNDSGNWLLQPLRESNLQLFALISIWISSKMHNTCPLSVKSLKSLGDEIIKDQHFTTRDFAEAELVFLKVLRFEIGASNIAFVFLEELLIQFRAVAKVGDILNFDVCMDIMDLLYETEETLILYTTPRSLAASILVVSYLVTVPKQQWEFPLLPWGKIPSIRLLISYVYLMGLLIGMQSNGVITSFKCTAITMHSSWAGHTVMCD
ncbi:cyclin-J18 isoform X2 [Magnolia sinica]|uniref:cyclin-J18 isoform X2 n=1 Tax=Magnolia sinica TaxID=86752 RepID=UPI00265A2D45|nr:cyclin-J18 isoform X2 [Magnolia sinica]